MRPREGDTYKVASSYGGAIYHEGAWRRFQCDLCLQVQVPAHQIVQPTQRAMEVAMRGKVELRCRGAETHRHVLAVAHSHKGG